MCWPQRTCHLPPVRALHWRHNERDGVPNHRRLDCLLNQGQLCEKCFHLMTSSCTWSHRITFAKYETKYKRFFSRQCINALENVVWKMLAILFRAQCISFFLAFGNTYQNGVCRLRSPDTANSRLVVAEVYQLITYAPCRYCFERCTLLQNSSELCFNIGGRWDYSS